jgi:hypothetical protein
MNTTESPDGVQKSKKDYKNSPQGQYKYWLAELTASEKRLRQFRKSGDLINKRYLGRSESSQAAPSADIMRLNFFHSNTKTLLAMLYGNLPKIDVSRSYADPKDDVARVAAEAMERLLNLDVADNGAEIDAVLRSCLQDRLLAGLGTGRVRYDMEEDDQGGVGRESAPIDYIHWGDVSWSWARTWAEVRWVSFKNYLTKDEMVEKFGEEAAKDANYKRQTRNTDDEGTSDDTDLDSNWQKAEVEEIWDKSKKKVVYVTKGYDQVLKTIDDPLGLSGFFPTPPFFAANVTTELYIPKADYLLAQDLYNEIDLLSERITIITKAVRVVGVYDSSQQEISQMLNTGVDNRMIPCESWAVLGEKGGLTGAIDFFPIQDVVEALDKLRQMRQESIGLLQQVTGMSDVMRGGLDNQYEGVGQSNLKAKFGSVQVQALQDQFARFATDLMQLKAEVISKHFDAESIVKMSNMQNSLDAEHLPQAVELIKQPQEARLRVNIRPESVAMVDYAQLKNERTEFLNAVGAYMQSSAPMLENNPEATPYLLQLMQWGLAGFKGASEIEGVIDKAVTQSIDALKQQQENPNPEPSEAQMQMQAEQQKLQGEMAKIQAKAQSDMQAKQLDMQADADQAILQHNIKMAEIAAQAEAKNAEIEAKMRADLMTEQVQTQQNMVQTAHDAEMEIKKDEANAEIELAKDAQKTSQEINKIAASTSAKIQEMTVQGGIKREEDARAQQPVNEGGNDAENE